MAISTLWYAENTAYENALAALRTFHSHFVEVRVSSFSASETIANTLDALAGAALRLWPDWYHDGSFFGAAVSSGDGRLSAELSVEEVSRSNQEIEPAWLKNAVWSAMRKIQPRMPELVREIEVRQLALALRNHIVGIVLPIVPEVAGQEHCDGFSRAVEWLERESGFDVHVLLPESLKCLDGLQRILYNTGELSPDALGRRTVPAGDEGMLEGARVAGKAHHASRGEQILADRIRGDGRFRGVSFLLNNHVTTVSGISYCVDLLWPDGMLAVEIDGYQHRLEDAQAKDYLRDFRFLVSGYRVLRFSHAQVVGDPDLTLDRIYDAVTFINSQKM